MASCRCSRAWSDAYRNYRKGIFRYVAAHANHRRQDAPAGTNQLEILLFSLGASTADGRRQTYGINVFKVREVMRSPQITRAPQMHPAVQGMVSLRGSLVPVVDLSKYVGIGAAADCDIMIVTEYNGSTQGFLVEAVDTILRLDWPSMRLPPACWYSRPADS